MRRHKIAVLPGDGIGPEGIDAAREVINADRLPLRPMGLVIVAESDNCATVRGKGKTQQLLGSSLRSLSTSQGGRYIR